MLAKVMRRNFGELFPSVANKAQAGGSSHSVIANPKFPEGTVAGLLKASAIERGDKDIVRINNQNFNWSLKELDRHSSAFAYGLLEAGFVRGDSIVMWIQRDNNAECLAAQIGANKAGVQCVYFDNNNAGDQLEHALQTTKAKGIIYAPHSDVVGTDMCRDDLLQSLMPELAQMHPGQDLDLPNYPHLRHIVQTGHNTIRGVNHFRDVSVYTGPSNSTYEMPQNHPDDVSQMIFKDHKVYRTHTNQDMVNYAQSTPAAPGATFFTPCGSSFLGFKTVMHAIAHQQKVIFPGDYNASNILKSLPRQDATRIICEPEFYSMELPPAMAAEYTERCAGIKEVILPCDSHDGKSVLFPNAKVSTVCKYSLE